VAGPDVYICEQCVELAETVIRSGQATELCNDKSTKSQTPQRRQRNAHVYLRERDRVGGVLPRPGASATGLVT
jgi:ATP-dependent protease Clp ATPase subunit